MSSPLVSLITVNLNGREHLGPFLASVFAQEFPQEQLEIIVVDNGSSDGSVELVRSEHPRVQLIGNEANLGFARANNQGAEAARGRYLALLNNDMRLDPSWVARMVSCLDETPPDVVCAGSLILNWDGSLIDFGGASMAFNGVGFQTHAHAPAETDEPRDFPDTMLFACGGALMVERDRYLETGGFDEDFFAYLEDVDFGWRLWVLGFRVAFCPDAIVYHRHNATSAQFDSHRKAVLVERNAFYSMFKNYDDESLSALLPGSLLLAFKRTAVRSGIRRDEFTFAPRSSRSPRPRPAGLLQTGESPLEAFTRVWREEGGRVAMRKSARKTTELLRQMRRRPHIAPRAEDARLIRSEAYATVVAMEDLIDHLPELLEKRRRIQAARRRPDEEIFRVFSTPFKAPEQSPKHREAYESAHETIVQGLRVVEYFESRSDAGSEREAAPIETDDLRALR
jgi:GT2 family glycosyltransferase